MRRSQRKKWWHVITNGRHLNLVADEPTVCVTKKCDNKIVKGMAPRDRDELLEHNNYKIVPRGYNYWVENHIANIPLPKHSGILGQAQLRFDEEEREDKMREADIEYDHYIEESNNFQRVSPTCKRFAKVHSPSPTNRGKKFKMSEDANSEYRYTFYFAVLDPFPDHPCMWVPAR